MTFLAALRHDRITAPWLIDGPINGETFQLYVEKVLVPTLRPGDIVIMDNLGSHKGKAVRRAIRAAGARLGALGSKADLTGEPCFLTGHRQNPTGVTQSLLVVAFLALEMLRHFPRCAVVEVFLCPQLHIHPTSPA
jgi:transposase